VNTPQGRGSRNETGSEFGGERLLSDTGGLSAFVKGSDDCHPSARKNNVHRTHQSAIQFVFDLHVGRGISYQSVPKCLFCHCFEARALAGSVNAGMSIAVLSA